MNRKRMDSCPKCGGTEGYSIRWIEILGEWCAWDGTVIEPHESEFVREYKMAYCQDCGKGFRRSTFEKLQAQAKGKDSPEVTNG